MYINLQDKPDILLFNWAQNIDGKIFKRQTKTIFNPKSDNLANTLWNASWTRVTKTCIMVKFLENCMRAEDTFQFLVLLDKNPTIKQIQDFLYIYRFNRNGAIQSSIFKEHRPIYINALKQLKKICVNEYVKKSIIRRIGI